VKFSINPILGVLVGMAITMIIQSSSATVGLTLTLIQVVLLNIDSAIPILNSFLEGKSIKMNILQFI